MSKNSVTAKTLGVELDVSLQQIQKYATGENEMSLKALLKACKVLNCTPAEIYPEIEMYDKGFNIPKTQSYSQDNENKTINHITNNYYYNNSGGVNMIKDFFSNAKLLDTNEKGAFLLRIAVFIIIIDDILYLGFRAFGYPYPPFLKNPDHLSQLIVAWAVFTWPISLVLPLIIRHWLVYIIPILTFRGIVGIIWNLITVDALHANNQIAGQTLWLTKTAIAIVLTLIYAFLVEKYLRNNKATKTK